MRPIQTVRTENARRLIREYTANPKFQDTMTTSRTQTTNSQMKSYSKSNLTKTEKKRKPVVEKEVQSEVEAEQEPEPVRKEYEWKPQAQNVLRSPLRLALKQKKEPLHKNLERKNSDSFSTKQKKLTNESK